MNKIRRGRQALTTILLSFAATGLATAVSQVARAQTNGSSMPQNWLHPAGIVARLQLDLFYLTLAIMVGVFVVVSSLLIYTIIRFRARGRTPAHGPGYTAGAETAAAGEGQRRKGTATPLPPQIDGNHTLEIIWTVIPVILLIIMAVPTVQIAYTLAAPPPEEPLEVRVVAHQWWWEFEYTDEGIVTANELLIPVGKPVQLTIEAADVIHKFWVPQLAGKLDAIPGRVNQMWLQADREGVFYGQCAELCGASHALMRFRVIAQSPEEFERSLAEWGREPAPRRAEEAEAFARGRRLFAERGCNACHAIEGTGWEGRIGPNLTGFGNRLTVAAGIMDNTPENLARWLDNPPAVKPDSRMPRLGLSSAEVNDLVVFLHSLK